jgi:hypothetical protein
MILNEVIKSAKLEDGDFGAGTFIVDPAAWQLTGLTEETCLIAQQTAADQFKEVADNINALDFS